MSNFDQFALACKLFGGECIYDDKGLPSVYVPIRKYQLNELLNTESTATHPAFIVNGVEVDNVYIGKYHGVISDNRMYSLPMEDPAVWMTWDRAKTVCQNKGNGHHMMTLAERALIALICKKAGYYPKGNNNYGKDSTESMITGIPSFFDENGTPCRILEGSGNLSYFHDGTANGIWGMNGNVWAWVGGYRTVNGEIQIIPDNNASANPDQSATSTLWKAILPDGTLVAPGTADTLKWNWLNNKVTLDTTTTVEDASRGTLFKDLAINTANVGEDAPLILKALALFPDGEDALGYGGDYFYMNTSGERMALVGGDWSIGGNAGVFSLIGRGVRGHSNSPIGSRPAYCKL